MAYGLCPSCGTLTHFRIQDPETWLKKYGPNETAAAPCLYCFPEITEGTEVIIRQVFQSRNSKIGANGKVSKVLKSTDGIIYKILLQDGTEDFFIRGELKKKSE